MRVLRKIVVALVLVGVAAAGAFLAGPLLVTAPPRPAGAVPAGDLDDYLRRAEAAAGAVEAGKEKTILWADPVRRERTPLALVYLHGFTACRVEISPVVEEVASNLGANVFFTRLAGHGLEDSGEALARVTVADWYRDAAEALAIGRRLGDRVVLVATSTGATLGLPFLVDDTNVFAAVLISPNHGPRDARARWVCGPMGPMWGRLLAGRYREVRAASEDTRAFWTCRYRIEAVVPMMNLVHIASRLDLGRIRCPVLTLYTPYDDVVNVELIRQRSAAIAAPGSRAVEMADMPSHVLAGRLKNPAGVPAVRDEILEFLHGLLPQGESEKGRKNHVAL